MPRGSTTGLNPSYGPPTSGNTRRPASSRRCGSLPSGKTSPSPTRAPPGGGSSAAKRSGRWHCAYKLTKRTRLTPNDVPGFVWSCDAWLATADGGSVLASRQLTRLIRGTALGQSWRVPPGPFLVDGRCAAGAGPGARCVVTVLGTCVSSSMSAMEVEGPLLSCGIVGDESVSLGAPGAAWRRCPLA